METLCPCASTEKSDHGDSALSSHHGEVVGVGKVGEWEQREYSSPKESALWEAPNLVMWVSNYLLYAGYDPGVATTPGIGVLCSHLFADPWTPGKHWCPCHCCNIISCQVPKQRGSVEFKLAEIECPVDPITAKHSFEVDALVNIKQGA